MCRKNLLPGLALLGFGAGLLLSLIFDSAAARLLLGGAAVCGGFWLLHGRC